MNDSGISVWSCASPVVRKWALGFSGFWNWASMWEFGVIFSNSSNTLNSSGSPFAPSALPMQNETHNRQKQKLEDPSTRLSWIGKHCSIKLANSVRQGKRIWALTCVKDDRALSQGRSVLSFGFIFKFKPELELVVMSSPMTTSSMTTSSSSGLSLKINSKSKIQNKKELSSTILGTYKGPYAFNLAHHICNLNLSSTFVWLALQYRKGSWVS